MISLTPVMQHLQAKPAGFTLPWFRDVAGAAEYAQAFADALPLPACWLVRAAENAKPADNEGRAEDLDLAFDAVIAIENIRTQRAGETDDVLLAYRHAVRKLLQGWEIEADIQPIEYKGGKVLEYTAQDIYWADRYRFNALITNYLPDPGPFSELVYTGVPAL